MPHMRSSQVLGMSILLVVLWAEQAQANKGTLRKYVIPPAALVNTLLPNPFVEIANSGCNSFGMTFRANPLAFVWRPNPKKDDRISFLPSLGISMLSYEEKCFPDEKSTASSSVTKLRGEVGLRTQWFPREDDSRLGLLGYEFAAGNTFGDRGFSGYLGGGLTFGGPMANIGLHYRHAFAKKTNFHNILLNIDIAIPVDLE